MIIFDNTYLPDFHRRPGDADETEKYRENTPVKQVGDTQFPM